MVTTIPNIVPYSTFKAIDGEIVRLQLVTTGSLSHYVKWWDIGDLAEDERFRTNEARVKNKEELTRILENRLQVKPADEWMKLFSQQNIPCGPIRR